MAGREESAAHCLDLSQCGSDPGGGVGDRGRVRHGSAALGSQISMGNMGSMLGIASYCSQGINANAICASAHA